MLKSSLFLFGILLLCAFSVSAQYAGRYTDGKDYAVYFEETQYGLTIRPVMWTATQLLRKTAKDKFEVVDRASRGAEFVRDENGNIVRVKVLGMDGEGLRLTRDGPLLPVEKLLAGRTWEAAREYSRSFPTEKALDVARQVLRRLPTKTSTVVSYLKYFAPKLRDDADFHVLMGEALVQLGDRASALKSFKRAHELNSNNEEVISSLTRLGALPVSPVNNGWKLPFKLSAVFAPPSRREIAAVEKDWATRPLTATGVRVELLDKIEIAGVQFGLRIVSHLVHGKRHYGAIITPENPGRKTLPLIIEAKGVSPTYFPLDLTRLASPRFMADLSDRFIYVVPSFRGEVLNFKDKVFTSEGDRTDALDGATDDTIALLNVALELSPQADANRICAFGHSRGGTVAMLVGIRDKRIKCVVNWAGPTDWFYAMGTNGWTEEELWGEALRIRANTQQTGGQNVERFLKRAVDGDATLQDVRHRMIASSPLYFAHRLPRSQHHYGLEDPSVPVVNGRRLVAKLGNRNGSPSRYKAYFYPGEGHDTDRLAAPAATRKFILDVLTAKR